MHSPSRSPTKRNYNNSSSHKRQNAPSSSSSSASASSSSSLWLPSLNVARQDAASCLVRLSETSTAIVVVGGRNSNSPSLANVELLEWQVQRKWWSLPSLPQGSFRCGCAVVSLGIGQIYVLGGLDEQSQPLSSMQYFSIGGGNKNDDSDETPTSSPEWKSAPNMSTPRWYASAVALKNCNNNNKTDNKTDNNNNNNNNNNNDDDDGHSQYQQQQQQQQILVVGGRDDAWQELDTCELYNATTNQKMWQEFPTLQTKRFGCAVVSLPNTMKNNAKIENNNNSTRILVLGGYNGKDWTTSCETMSYDSNKVSSSNWSYTTPMPQAVQFCVAAVIGEWVLVRGQTSDHQVILQCYHSTRDEWKVVKNQQRSSAGSSKTTISAAAATSTTTTNTTMGATMVSVGQRLVILGGASGEDLEATPACQSLQLDLYRLWNDGNHNNNNDNNNNHSPYRRVAEEENEDATEVAEDDFSVGNESAQHPFLPPPPFDLTSSISGSGGQSVHSRTPRASSMISSATNKSKSRRKVENAPILDNFGVPVLFTGYVSTVDQLHRPHCPKGKMTWKLTGDAYEGSFEHGARQGRGHMMYSNGDSFDGWFHDDQREGKGTYRYRDGRQYTGMYIDDSAQDPQGQMTWKDGTTYVGQFSKSKRTGKGTVTFTSNVKYEGDFLNGKYHGQGVCHFVDGSIYQGQWKHGKAHGQGRLTDAKENVVHDGKWVNDGPVYTTATTNSSTNS